MWFRRSVLLGRRFWLKVVDSVDDSTEFQGGLILWAILEALYLAAL